ncbi:MAG TPA: hypothetical protein VMF52_14760 [Steroidobacteraceae bacterium]|nr:hypothetical protein [Steroidobacteraceae bacterium]
MQAPDSFELIGTRGLYRPTGVMTLEQAIETVAQGMLYARFLGLTDMMANTSGLSGYPPPSTFGRYALARRWAECGGGVLRLGIVTKPESIDPQKIGIVMARNRGLDTDVFTNEPDALRWLDSRAAFRR